MNQDITTNTYHSGKELQARAYLHNTTRESYRKLFIMGNTLGIFNTGASQAAQIARDEAQRRLAERQLIQLEVATIKKSEPAPLKLNKSDMPSFSGKPDAWGGLEHLRDTAYH